MDKWTPINMVESGKAIRYFREKNGWTQGFIADSLGVSTNAVSRWENGKSLPTLDNVMRLADMMNVYVEDLIIMGFDEEDVECTKPPAQLPVTEAPTDLTDYELLRLKYLELLRGTLHVLNQAVDAIENKVKEGAR